MRKSRKLISLLLAVVLTLSCFACLSSVSAFATEGDTLKGDVDKNGRVEITDVTLIQLYVAKDAGTVAKFENGTYDLAAADVDGNGTIDIMDATFTQLIIAHAEPTTAEPTTEAPTTTEPAEPTTEAPTTEEPTEAPTTEPAGEDIYVLAGSSNFVENGWSPDPASYVMTKGEDGVYSADVPNVAAEEGALYQVKVVQFVGGDPANAVWHGMDGTDLNYDFMLNADGTVTVTYNPETAEIAVKGDTVIPPVYKIDSITAVGGGQGNFLNGITWDPAAAENRMTEVKPGVYEITYEDVDTNTEYQFKFAANGGWDINWGLVKDTEAKLNEANPSQYNGENILFNVESEDDTCNVTLQLDITNWDTTKKTGATYTIFVNREEPTTQPAPETLAVNVNTGVSEHVTDMPKVFALDGEAAKTVNVGDTFTLTWKLDSDAKAVESLQWIYNYDATKLELVKAEMPQITSGAEINDTVAGVVKANASNIYGYAVDADNAFINLTFKALASGTVDTTMTLDEFALVPVEEPTTEAPTTVEPTTVAPTTVEPTTVAPTTVEPTTVAPTTVAPTTVAPTTVAPTTKKSTSDSATKDSSNSSNGTVKTGSASMAVIILLVLVSATAAIYFARRRDKE